MKDSVVLGVEDIEKLAMGIAHIPAEWNTLIEETTSQSEEQELLRLICKYLRIVQISFLVIIVGDLLHFTLN